MASRASAAPVRPRSSAARPSMTVSTRLRKEARPATCGAAPGAGGMPSSSTTASTFDAGKAMRRPPRLAMRRSSAIGAALGLAAAERADQRGAIVAVDAVVAGVVFRVRTQAHHLAGLDRASALAFLGQDQYVGGNAFARGDDPIAKALDQGP